MKLSWGICVLFYSAAAVAILLPVVQEQAWRKINLKYITDNWVKWLGGLLMAGAFSVLASLLQLQIAGAWPYLLGAAVLYGLLSALSCSPASRGILLMATVFAVFSGFSDLTAMQLPLLAALIGLALGKLFSPAAWEDFILPGMWLVGLAWLTANTSEALLVSQISMLAIFSAIGMVVHALQVLPILTRTPVWLKAIYLTITGGLAAWLAVQNMLLQPELLPWVGLFAGAILLGFLLPTTEDALASTEIRVQDEANEAAPLKLSGDFQAGAVAIVLIGVASLVASRLFGTAGWVVLVVGLLANRRVGNYVAVAVLFLLGRVLLQVFLSQYSANVTGINITHPYASAALYAGFTMMMLLPAGINALQTKARKFDAASGSESMSLTSDFSPLPSLLLGGASLLTAGLSNYFLHGEATASLLLALLVSGLGVSFFAAFNQVQARALPVFVTLLTLAGVLATPEILDWGNAAEKGQKLVVLGAALAIVLLTGFLTQQFGSGRKPVQVS